MRANTETEVWPGMVIPTPMDKVMTKEEFMDLHRNAGKQGNLNMDDPDIKILIGFCGDVAGRPLHEFWTKHGLSLKRN